MSLVFDEGLKSSFDYGFNKGMLKFKHKLETSFDELSDKTYDELEKKEED